MGLTAFQQSGRPAQVFSLLSFCIVLCLWGLIFGPFRLLNWACGVILAIALFGMRMRFRCAYGALEVFFGLFVLWDAAGKGHGSFISAFSKSFDTFQLSVIFAQTFGAIYVLIRGLDNFLQGLPEGTRKSFEERVRNWNA